MSYRLSAPLTAAVALALLLAGAPAKAELLITEVSSKSSENPEDYFELTNTGALVVDVTGWRFDDESGALADSVPLMGISTIAPGESVVFFQLDTADAVADTATFRSYWGGLPGVQVGYHDGPGLGKGDGIVLFDAASDIAIELYYGDGDATDPAELITDTHAGDWGAGNSTGSDIYENDAAIWVPGTTSPQQFVLAEAGAYGSFQNSFGEWGSPGITAPEPATAMLAALGLMAMPWMRRR